MPWLGHICTCQPSRLYALGGLPIHLQRWSGLCSKQHPGGLCRLGGPGKQRSRGCWCHTCSDPMVGRVCCVDCECHMLQTNKHWLNREESMENTEVHFRSVPVGGGCHCPKMPPSALRWALEEPPPFMSPLPHQKESPTNRFQTRGTNPTL